MPHLTCDVAGQAWGLFPDPARERQTIARVPQIHTGDDGVNPACVRASVLLGVCDDDAKPLLEPGSPTSPNSLGRLVAD